MKTEKILKYISNHPFIFLTSIVLIASCCVGGLISSARIASLSPAQISITNTETLQNYPTETLTLIPQNTLTLELTATSPTILPSSIVTDTPSLDKTSTITLVTLPSITALAPTLTTASLVVYFVDVGQGDSTLIIAPDGKTILIDGGNPDTGIVNFLQRTGVKSIDLMIATHPHSDHIGGLVQVLKSIPVAKVITNGQSHTTTTYEQFLDAIASAKAEYAEAKRGDTITLGNLSFDVLNPVSTTGDMNGNSLVLRLVYHQVIFLFTGDAGKDAETSMMAAGLPLSANILKVGHHGSNSASSPSFLAEVKPSVAIYFAGLGNQYGHPHAETITSLRNPVEGDH